MTITLSGLPVAMAANGLHMVTTKMLIKVYTTLLGADVILTLIGVYGLGATEINPLATLYGFTVFMLIKVVLSITTLFVIYKYCLPIVPTVSRYGILVLVILYGTVCASNVCQIAAVIL